MKMRLTSVLLLTFALAVCAPASASTIYTNGPIDGTNFGYNIGEFGTASVANSFDSDGPYTVTGFDAGLWVNTGGPPAGTVYWTISTGAPSWLAGTTLVASGTATWSSVFIETNIYGAAIYKSTVSGMNVAIGTGTYWLELRTSDTRFILWDINSGPSLAYQNSQETGPAGPIPSESFTVYGSSNVPVPPSALLLGSGLLGLAGWRRFRKG